ncbi:MAG: DUF1800 domain-containing protein, partial [Pseudomonadota bacterium]|nr:DUF1800 domain-containing protein [Pseudomonadota bacterium]
QVYLDQALAARDDRLPPPIQAMIDNYDVTRTPPLELLAAYRDQRKQLRQDGNDTSSAAARKALGAFRKKVYAQDASVPLLHAIYGSDQLKEQVVWFWLNHFSIYVRKGGVGLVTADYVENTIRPHALGRFKDLVMASLQSPAMLQYLDNASNVKGKTNENYARELMELHTLGVNQGYTQQDVQQLALILTGAGIAKPGPHAALDRRQPKGMVRHGAFVFRPRLHDFSDKQFLGHTIKGSGYAEIEQAVDLITRQPACARFVSYQLAQYFVADTPPEALVSAMARTFQRTDGDITAVLRTMFESPLLTAGAHPRKLKDPAQFLISSIRFVQDGRPITHAQPLVKWLNDLGEPVFGRITPDGWPLDSASWSGSGQMAKRFDVASEIGSGRNRLFTDAEADGKGPPPKGNAPDLDTPLYRSTLAPLLGKATLAALGKARSRSEWNTFLLSSPEFNYR